MTGIMDSIADTVRRVFVRPAAIDSTEALAEFIDSRSAFMAQKCVTEFCRVRAGVHWEKLFGEEIFQRALIQSNWAAYTPAMAMIAEMVESHLRPESGGRRSEIVARLTLLADGLRSGKSLPEDADAAGWAAQDQMVAEALSRTAFQPARPVRMMPEPLARTIHAALPMDSSVVEADYDYIFNNLRMNLLRAHDEFSQRAVPRGLVDSLLGAATRA